MKHPTDAKQNRLPNGEFLPALLTVVAVVSKILPPTFSFIILLIKIHWIIQLDIIQLNNRNYSSTLQIRLEGCGFELPRKLLK